MLAQGGPIGGGVCANEWVGARTLQEEFPWFGALWTCYRAMWPFGPKVEKCLRMTSRALPIPEAWKDLPRVEKESNGSNAVDFDSSLTQISTLGPCS